MLRGCGNTCSVYARVDKRAAPVAAYPASAYVLRRADLNARTSRARLIRAAAARMACRRRIYLALHAAVRRVLLTRQYQT